MTSPLGSWVVHFKEKINMITTGNSYLIYKKGGLVPTIILKGLPSQIITPPVENVNATELLGIPVDISARSNGKVLTYENGELVFTTINIESGGGNSSGDFSSITFPNGGILSGDLETTSIAASIGLYTPSQIWCGSIEVCGNAGTSDIANIVSLAMKNDGSGTINMNGGTISMNGGNIGMQEGNISMNGGAISMNNGSGSGGGNISMEGGTINMNSGNINMNNGVGSNGGNIDMDGGTINLPGAGNINLIGGALTANNAGSGTAKMRLSQKGNTEMVWSYNVDQNNSDAIDDVTNSAFKFSIQGTGGGGYDALKLQAQEANATWSVAHDVLSVGTNGVITVLPTGNISFPNTGTAGGNSTIQTGSNPPNLPNPNASPYAGVSLLCSAGYELNWANGILNIYNGTTPQPLAINSSIDLLGCSNSITMSNGSIIDVNSIQTNHNVANNVTSNNLAIGYNNTVGNGATSTLVIPFQDGFPLFGNSVTLTDMEGNSITIVFDGSNSDGQSDGSGHYLVGGTSDGYYNSAIVAPLFANAINKNNITFGNYNQLTNLCATINGSVVTVTNYCNPPGIGNTYVNGTVAGFPSFTGGVDNTANSNIIIGTGITETTHHNSIQIGNGSTSFQLFDNNCLSLGSGNTTGTEGVPASAVVNFTGDSAYETGDTIVLTDANATTYGFCIDGATNGYFNVTIDANPIVMMTNFLNTVRQHSNFLTVNNNDGTGILIQGSIGVAGNTAISASPQGGSTSNIQESFPSNFSNGVDTISGCIAIGQGLAPNTANAIQVGNSSTSVLIDSNGFTFDTVSNFTVNALIKSNSGVISPQYQTITSNITHTGTSGSFTAGGKTITVVNGLITSIV